MTSSWAVAAGVTSIATTMMIPTAWMLTTIVTPRSASSRYSSPATGSPDAAAPSGIERREQELLADREDDGQDDRAEHRDLDQVARPDAEDVAEQVAEQIGDVAVDRAEQHHPERERPGEQHADRRVEPQPAAARDQPDRERRRRRPRSAPPMYSGAPTM